MEDEHNSVGAETGVVLTRRALLSHLRALLLMVIIVVVSVLGFSVVGKKFVSEVTNGTVETSSSTMLFALNMPAPAFELPDHHGEKMTLAKLRGSPVILFYFSTWNTLSLDQLALVGNTHFPDGVLVFAVNTQEDPLSTETKIQRGGYTTPVLFDENGAVAEAYGVRNLPATYFIDRAGLIRDVGVGLLSSEEMMSRVERIMN